MALSVTQKVIMHEITRLRMTLLIHRYLYYVKASPIVSDQRYDEWERKLKGLVTENPVLAGEADYNVDCPTKCVGSSNPDDYLRNIEQLAESLLEYHNRRISGAVSECGVGQAETAGVLRELQGPASS